MSYSKGQMAAYMRDYRARQPKKRQPLDRSKPRCSDYCMYDRLEKAEYHRRYMRWRRAEKKGNADA